MKKEIRVALVIDELVVSSWKYKLVKRILDEKIANVSCAIVLLKELVSEKIKRSKIQDFHINFDKKYYKPLPDAFEDKNLKDLIPEQNNRILDGFEDRLKKDNLDLLIWLSDKTPIDLFYTNLKYGILSFAHGDDDTRFSHFGYEEFMEMKGVITSALLLKKNVNDSGKIISQTWSTMPSLSLSRSRNEHAWKLHSFIPRALNNFLKEGETFFSNKPQYLKKENLSKKKSLSEISALINLSNHFCRFVYNFIRKKFYREQWLLLFKNETNPSTSVDDFKIISPPKDRFWADPILVQRENKNYLFFEELPFSTNRGFLSVVEINENGFSGPSAPILEKPYHLSYPFIFELKDTYYMIPESNENKNIQLYECTKFPNEWKHKMDLMTDIVAVDTTLFYHNEKWWMFTVISECRGIGKNDELFLFYADTPLTKDWKSHPQNPIISDVRSARPGGSIYIQDGKIIRPSQDCSKKYGYGINLNEIEILTETAYREKRIQHIAPTDIDKNIRRAHSYAHQTGVSVIDGLIQRSKYF
ncbi:MAG: hypothetical protein AB8H03_15720 [Saprospiraceae bacterium]